ncbi:MAG: hypothetical protein ACLR3C_14985 [Eggerthella lenta]
MVVLPCLACLSPEFWTLVLTENIPVRIAADLAYCADCERAGEMGEMLYAHAVETAEEWSGAKVGYLDEIPEKENLVRDLANPEGVDRRSAFTNLVSDVGDIASGKRRLRNSDVLQQFYERKERARARARLNLVDGVVQRLRSVLRSTSSSRPASCCSRPSTATRISRRARGAVRNGSQPLHELAGLRRATPRARAS